MFKRYSYDLSFSSPVWPGNPPAAVVEPFESIEKGDQANTFRVNLFTHSGTHIDVPLHFNRNGKNAIELGIEHFIFYKPVVIEIEKHDRELITVEDLKPYEQKISSCDVLCISTGWASLRFDEPERYAASGPGVSNSAVEYLVDGFPSMRALGLDFISLGSASNLEETVKSHQTVTGSGEVNGKFLIVIEDMIVDKKLEEAKRIYGWPLFIEGADASPITLVAEF